MDRGKRASMREGPLSALFRSTAELDEEKAEPTTPRADAPVAEPSEPERITLPEPPEPAPRIKRSKPAPRVEREAPAPPRAYEQRLRDVFSADIPNNIMEREPASRPVYGREESRAISTPERVTHPILRVVGVGGAGVNAVNRMI